LKSQKINWFCAGNIYGETTGGTLCDRLIVEKISEKNSINLIDPRISWWPFQSKPGFAGLCANIINIFRSFPRESIIWVDSGLFRDIFFAVWVWRILFNAKIILIVHHLESNAVEGWRYSYRTFAEKLLLLSAHRLLTVSESTLQQMLSFGVSKSNCSIIPVSRRFDPNNISPPDRRAKLKPEFVFLFVGTVEPRKALEDAIEALHAYQGECLVRFRCVGKFIQDDPYFNKLMEISSKNKKIKVDFLGTLSHKELESEFRAADAFLFTSHWEGYGIAIEEAFSFGLPVIAYNRGSIPELFSKKQAEGWIIPFKDNALLKKAVKECIDNQTLRLDRGNAAYRRSLELVSPFDWESLIHKIVS